MEIKNAPTFRLGKFGAPGLNIGRVKPRLGLGLYT
jgi:hypothetical protein